MKSKKKHQPEVPPLSPLPPKPETLTIGWRWIAIGILALYLAISVGCLVVTPVLTPSQGSLINAPDEAAHWGYIQVLAKEGRLPHKGDPTYEWHQPPLYYFTASPFSSLGPRAARAVAIAFGFLSVCLIFMATRRLFPSDPEVAVLGMGLAALLPMRQAAYASVGNDSLLELLCSAFFFALVPAFTHGFTARRALAIGAVLGAALLTKTNAVLLLPLLAFALVLLRKKAEEKSSAIWAGATVVFVVALTASVPIFVRNAQLYGQPLPLKAFNEEFANTAKASDWIGGRLADDLWSGDIVESDAPLSRAGYLRLIANWSLRTFIAAYTPVSKAHVGAPLFPPTGFYVPYLVLALASATGLTRLHFKRRKLFNSVQLSFIWLFFVFAGIVALSFAGFTWTYFQAQGRYLYPAMLPIAILSSLGIRAALPEAKRELGTLAVLIVLALLALAFFFAVLQPSYAALPRPTA
jgi:4-amino-4-deoxy-L-arabinose transferase-like glycosyltransferase